MKKRIILTATAATMLLSTAAFAQNFVEKVISDLQSNGFSNIEVKKGRSQVKAEGVRNGRKIEVVYDLSTGKIVKQEIVPVSSDDSGNAGVADNGIGDVVSVSSVGDDGLSDDMNDDGSSHDESDDDSGHDESDDDSSHDESDDDSGHDESDDDSGHDESDDDSGHDDSGHDESDDENDD